MRLGLNLRYLGAAGTGGGPATSAALAREAERLGFEVLWVAEAFSSDAPSMLGWLAAQTCRIGLGSAVMQIPARSPAATAMTAMTLDLVSAGRFRLGLGVSGPQVSEGWHGVRFGQPLRRTREYVDIVRLALRREEVRYGGEHYPLPLPGGPGRALRLGARPLRRAIPIYLAGVGPRSIRLAGEIADGWLSVFLAPEFAGEQLSDLRAGGELAGRELAGFDVVAAVPLVAGDDLDRIRVYTAHYLGGWGSRDQNFYNQLAVRMGYADAARAVQDHYLAGRLRAAAAAVPDTFLDRTALAGPPGRLADRIQAYADAGVTTLSLIVFPECAEDGVRTLRAAAEAFDRAGVAA